MPLDGGAQNKRNFCKPSSVPLPTEHTEYRHWGSVVVVIFYDKHAEGGLGVGGGLPLAEMHSRHGEDKANGLGLINDIRAFTSNFKRRVERGGSGLSGFGFITYLEFEKHSIP